MTWERRIQHQELKMIYSPGQEGDRKMQQLYVVVSMIVRELEKRASLRKERVEIQLRLKIQIYENKCNVINE